MISKFQTFRSSMLEFQRIARVVQGQKDECKQTDQMQNALEDLIERIWELKDKYNLSKDNITQLLQFLRKESAAKGKYQLMRQNLYQLRNTVNQMEAQREQRRKEMKEKREIEQSYDVGPSSEHVSI